jgi:Icc protein
MTIRIVQLTDLHLYQDSAGRLAGVPTWATFRSVLEQVRRQQSDLDYLILTGDLAQDEALATYLMLREALGDWVASCRIIPGNHDDRAKLRKAFPELSSENEGALTFVLSAGGWRIVGLDSHVPGEVRGRVDSAQLAWLRTILTSAPGTPTLLFVHHPPIPINVAWIDKLGLDEAAELVELIETSPDIKVVCAGHVHQAFAGHIGTAEVYTTPSTCVQFAARAEKAFDTQMAGYRTFTLDKDGHHTEVHRLLENINR